MTFRETTLAIMCHLAAPVLCLVVFLTTVPSHAADSVCVTCHEAQPGRGGSPAHEWKNSVHAEGGISCHDCHGGDPSDAVNAMSPARGFIGKPEAEGIPAFCGRCHVGIRDEYLQSGHGKALGSGGPTCVTCHGSHAVRKASLAIINEKTCTPCHTFERAAQIREAMLQTEIVMEGIEGTLRDYRGKGIVTEPMEKSLFSIRNRYRRLFHETNVEKIRTQTAQIHTELNKITSFNNQMASQQQQRKIIGVFVVGGALLAALLLYLLKKTYDT